MISLPAGTRVWLAVGRTDMRKGFDGLAAYHAAPVSPLRLTGGFGHDLHRQEGHALFRRRHLLRRYLAPPLEDLVGVHVVTPRHDRNRRARLQCLRHNPTLAASDHCQCFALSNLRLVSTKTVVDSSVAVAAMPHHRADQRSAAGVLHRALTVERNFVSKAKLGRTPRRGRVNNL
jgi:hypothetical protein